MNTNKTLYMLLWTCCKSVLYVHVFQHKHNFQMHAQRWTCYMISVPSGGLVP
jgi:hypothetical protein